KYTNYTCRRLSVITFGREFDSRRLHTVIKWSYRRRQNPFIRRVLALFFYLSYIFASSWKKVLPPAELLDIFASSWKKVLPLAELLDIFASSWKKVLPLAELLDIFASSWKKVLPLAKISHISVNHILF